MKFLKENMEQANLGRLLEQDEHKRRSVLVEGWKGTGYLLGLEGRDVGNMAVLMENQKKQILKENNTTADMAIFDTIAIPMLRRQNAVMVTPNLISVQPLSYPHGMVFFMDYKVSSTKKPFKSGYLEYDNSGETPVASNKYGNDFQNVSGYDQFYDNGNYDVSKGRVIPTGWVNGAWHGVTSAQETALTKTVDLGGVGETKIALVEFDLAGLEFSMDSAASMNVSIAGKVQGKDYFVQRVPQNFGDDIMSSGRTDTGLTASTHGRAANNQPNKKLLLRIIPASAGMGATTEVKLGYRQYLNLELYPAFSSELKLEIKQVQIDTQIHKLKTAWTVELAQELMSYYAIDAEAELSQLLAEQIAGEKDRLIVSELVNLSAHFEIWNADFDNAVNPNPAETVFRGTEAGYNQTLVFKINQIDAKIRKATKQGGANWILISAEGAAKLSNLNTFKPSELDSDGRSFALGVEKVGTLETKYTVYVDPNLPGHVCLIGRKGTSIFDTGYVYAPYIEYILSPTVMEDQEFNPRKMISSRFGTKMLNNRFYGVVYMKGLASYDVFQPTV